MNLIKNKTAFKVLGATFIALLIFAPFQKIHGQSPSDTSFWNGVKTGSVKAVADKISSAFTDISFSVVGKIVFSGSFIVAYFFGLLVAVEAWLISVIVNINLNIPNSSIVGIGMAATMSLANLGFVLGIIIIALATILRRETYGIKQLLARLVFIAIIVNFGLPIAGIIIKFSDSLTLFFLNCFNPGGSACGGNQNGLQASANFASALAGAFNPQKGFLALNRLANPVASSNFSDSTLKSIESVFSVTGADIGKMLGLIFSVMFVFVMVLVISITLGVFLVLLLIRYVSLIVLLILLPIAWLLFIFPATKSNWTKWWHKFLRWSFFPPLSIFFLYLAILVSRGLGYGAEGGKEVFSDFAKYTSDSNQLWAALTAGPSNFLSAFFESALQQIVVIVLAGGGLFAANSLSLEGASMVMTGAKATKNFALNLLATGGKKGASTLVPQGIRAKLQAGGYKFLPQKAQVALGEALGKIERAGGKELVEANKEWAERIAKERPEEGWAMLQAGTGIAGGLSHEKGLALARALVSDPKDLAQAVMEGRMVGNQKIGDFLQGGTAKAYGMEELIRKAADAGITKEVMDAKKGMDLAVSTKDESRIKLALENLTAALEKAANSSKNPSEAMAAFMQSDKFFASMTERLLNRGYKADEADNLKASGDNMRTASALAVSRGLAPHYFLKYLEKLERGDQHDLFARILKQQADQGKKPATEFFRADTLERLQDSTAPAISTLRIKLDIQGKGKTGQVTAQRNTDEAGGINFGNINPIS